MVSMMKVAGLKEFSSEKMKKVGLFDTDRLFCDLYCFEPGQSQKVHLHPHSDKIYFVLEGRGRFQIGPEQQELVEGNITMAPAGVEHGVLNNSSDRLVLLVFMAPKP